MYTRPPLECPTQHGWATKDMGGYTFTASYHISTKENALSQIKGKDLKALAQECNKRIDCVAFREE